MKLEKLLNACENAIINSYRETPSQESREYAEGVIEEIEKAKSEKTYTVEEIKAYALSWAAHSLSMDAMVTGEPENERLFAFIHYIDEINDSDNIENFLQREDWREKYVERSKHI